MKKSITKILLTLALTVFFASSINFANVYAGDLYFIKLNYKNPSMSSKQDPFYTGYNWFGYEKGNGFVEITGGWKSAGDKFVPAKVTDISSDRNKNVVGYTFDGYYDASGKQIIDKDGKFSTAIKDSYFNTYTVGPTSDPTGITPIPYVELNAKWKGVVNKITLDDNNGSSKKIIYKLFNDGFYKDENCDAADKINTITIPTKNGYTFNGYRSSDKSKFITKSGNLSDTNISLTKDEDVELVANWISNVFKVYLGAGTNSLTLTSKEGSELFDNSGKKVTKIDMSKFDNVEGYEIDGFYAGKDKYIDKYGNIIDTRIYSDGLELELKYTEKVYPVILCKDKDGSAINSVGKLYVKYNDAAYVDENCKNLATNIFKQKVVSTPSLAKTLNIFDRFGDENIEYISKDGTVNNGNIVGAVSADKDLLSGAKSDISLYAYYAQEQVEFFLGSTAKKPVYLYGGSRLSESWNDPYNKLSSLNLAGNKLAAADIPTSTDTTQKFAGYQDSNGVIYIDEKGNIKPVASSLAGGTTMTLTAAWAPVTSPTDPTTPTSPTSGTTTDNSGGSRSGGNGGGGGGGGGGKISGSSYAGWKNVNGKWYFYINATTPYYGWICESGVNYYYLDHDDGDAMAVGYRLIGGIVYYFKETGVMAKNELVNDIQVGADGALARIDNCVKASSYAKDEASNEYYLLDDKNNVIHDSIATCKGLVYATQQLVSTSVVPTLRFGLIEIGDVVLNFNAEKGGYLDNVFKKSKKVFGNAIIIKETGLILNKK